MQTKPVAKQPKKVEMDHVFHLADVPNPSLAVCVIVPARNEARNIVKTLDALRLQTCNKGLPLPYCEYEVLLMANNCSDKTYAVAKKYQQRYPFFQLHVEEVFLPPSQANIGTVRRLLMDRAYARLTAAGNPNGIIASTDGDSEVDTNWIHFIKEEIANGSDAVGGRILTHRNTDSARLFHLRDVAFRSLLAQAESLIDPDPNDPWPRHFQYFGASLSVTCDMYHKCGRLPQVAYLEDSAFHRSLNMMDAKIRKSPKVKVYTSTRMSGRVAVGFSEQLRKWHRKKLANRTQLVGSVEAELIVYNCRKQLRNVWQQMVETHTCNLSEVGRIANELTVSNSWLYLQLFSNQYFGQLWENVIGKLLHKRWFNRFDDVPITDAIDMLRKFVKSEGQLATKCCEYKMYQQQPQKKAV